MIIPDKSLTEDIVKKIFRLMFPLNEKMLSLETCFREKALHKSLGIILKDIEGEHTNVLFVVAFAVSVRAIEKVAAFLPAVEPS